LVGGYDWLGPERVLNPNSILNFFNYKFFDPYWPLSGVPNHLTTLIQKRPAEFLQPRLDGYLSEEIGKVQFGKLEAVPVLFHSGYLTIDRRQRLSRVVKGIQRKVGVYSFRLPNNEVGNSYDELCLQTIFGQSSLTLINLGQKFLRAFADRDAGAIAKILGDLLSGVTYWRHKEDEAYYHSLIQIAFAAAGLETIGELSGAVGRTDIALLLPGGARAVVEIKYRSAGESPKREDIDGKLDEALGEALKAIATKDYAGPLRLAAGELVGLGVAVCGRNEVRAGFVEASRLEKGRKPPRSRPRRPPRSPRPAAAPGGPGEPIARRPGNGPPAYPLESRMSVSHGVRGGKRRAALS
jgi:hypothetical protein